MAVQGGGSVDLFDSYFVRADLDKDGRISGAEAVAFFQGSNLSKQVLAQIWMHADPRSTGYLGRAEFYNALKLVTVAQSKRELTPDIVKAALYGPASSKIPAPKINLAAISAPQQNSMTPRPPSQMGTFPPTASRNVGAQQMGTVPPTASQNIGTQMGIAPPMASQSSGFRGQVPPNGSMNQQYFPPQGNQSMRPPLQPPTGTPSRPPQAVMGNLIGPGVPNSNISSSWPGGVTNIATSQAPNRGTSPLVAPPKPQDPRPTSPLVGSQNGFGSDPMFSVSQPLQKQASLPTYNAPVSSSPLVTATSLPQSSGKPDLLGSLQAFTRQSTGGQPWQPQPPSKPNQNVQHQPVSSGIGISVGVGGTTTSQPQQSWPKMTRAGVQKYINVFVGVDTDKDGKITGDEARNLFMSWRLPREILRQVWALSDQDNDSMLSMREFCIALYLMERSREGQVLPPTLPSSVLLDETLLSLAGPPNASLGGASWAPAPGLNMQQRMPGAQQMTPVQGPYQQSDRTMQFNQQKVRVPGMENSHMNQLNNGEQNSPDLKSQEAEEMEKKVEGQKMYLDSREKMEFYRTKMQDLVLYKSRCDNRLNEITERALADKREAELLGKKYEEKYKQVTEIASKLTIEEASFRDIQERKMELSQAITKMEQGGSADGILQVRADRIQSDLEELLRALTERCKKHGLNVKSSALIDLPPGWQPGIPEISAVWDEDWDKFKDEGFTTDVAVLSSAKSASVQKETSSPIDSYSPDSLSNADNKSEKSFSRVDRGLESESAYAHSEDESVKSPPGSPPRQTVFESPPRERSDNHFRESFDADSETQRSFDEPAWGTFDNNDDIDSVWGFNPSKESNHGEKDFFGSSEFGNSPTRSESFQTDSIFQSKSSFGFDDSVPSTPMSRASNSPPRYSTGSTVDPFFNNMSRFDSFSSTTNDKRENFSRFDSMNSTTSGFDHSRGYSFDDSDPFGSSGPFKVSSDK